MKKMICAGFIALASLAASAQSATAGLVTGTTPTGIYLTNQNGTAYIPYAGASFTINGQPIEARYVIDGMNVQVYPQGYNQNGYNNNYQNSYYNNNNNGYNNYRYNYNRRYRR
ncbi:MAG: hypothetical protein KF760_03825 [Candidatus Eremiobacteraeota bacterium]|nr:hypothetical protein [Candidatus Eremiobacteraeota bacterium]MCW5870099.1 hypothetical protein [Candidatus Eremiobacteraeota bacterium]